MAGQQAESVVDSDADSILKTLARTCAKVSLYDVEAILVSLS
jgi:hypothetical protein